MAKLKIVFNKELSTLGILLSVIILSTIIGLGVHLVFAAPWVGPSANPPNNNVAPPITTAGGTIGGSLTVTGNFYPARIGPKYSTWSGIGDGGAAIINDNGSYKALMIVGSDQNNTLAGCDSLRCVRLWDRLRVEGNIMATGNLTAGGAIDTESGGAYNGGAVYFDYHTLNSNSDGWLYLGDQNAAIYEGRGIAAAAFYASIGITVVGDSDLRGNVYDSTANPLTLADDVNITGNLNVTGTVTAGSGMGGLVWKATPTTFGLANCDDSTWTSYDATAATSANAKAVIISISGGGGRWFNLYTRKNGSTANFEGVARQGALDSGGSWGTNQNYGAMIIQGVDSGQIFQYKCWREGVYTVQIVGYFE